MNRNGHSSDLVLYIKNFVEQAQKFAMGVPNHRDIMCVPLCV